MTLEKAEIRLQAMIQLCNTQRLAHGVFPDDECMFGYMIGYIEEFRYSAEHGNFFHYGTSEKLKESIVGFIERDKIDLPITLRAVIGLLDINPMTYIGDNIHEKKRSFGGDQLPS